MVGVWRVGGGESRIAAHYSRFAREREPENRAGGARDGVLVESAAMKLQLLFFSFLLLFFFFLLLFFFFLPAFFSFLLLFVFFFFLLLFFFLPLFLHLFFLYIF